MGTKMKGIYKGFKCSISQIFVVKEPEIEIGGPTDVKHIAHIGWDGATGTAPSWMKEFKTGSDFAATSIGHSGGALSTWSAQDCGKSVRQQTESDMFKDQSEVSNVKKKQRRKKPKSTSSPRSNSSSTSRSSRAAAKSKTNFVTGNAKPTNIEVA